MNAIFAVSVALHQQDVEEDKALLDTTVQEKVITYPTDNITNARHKEYH